jgi:hypothetical protein
VRVDGRVCVRACVCEGDGDPFGCSQLHNECCTIVCSRADTTTSQQHTQAASPSSLTLSLASSISHSARVEILGSIRLMWHWLAAMHLYTQHPPAVSPNGVKVFMVRGVAGKQTHTASVGGTQHTQQAVFVLASIKAAYGHVTHATLHRT